MIRILEDKFKEEYKLDIELQYSKENDLNDSVILDYLGNEICDYIKDEKSFICDDNDFSNFEIQYSRSDEENGIITFSVFFSKKIIGKYFVDKIRSLLKDYSTRIYSDNSETNVTVNSVEPILRYVG